MAMHMQVLHYFRHGIAVHPGDVIVDVGANIGMFALEVLLRTQGQASVVCCEPAPRLFRQLVDNLKWNFPSASAKCLKVAIGDREGEVDFFYRPHSPSMSSMEVMRFKQAQIRGTLDILYDPADKGELALLVPRWVRWIPRKFLRAMLKGAVGREYLRGRKLRSALTTLSAVIDREGLSSIDLLKIDVEGAEWLVLAGIQDHHWPLIRSVVVEVHDVDGRLARVRAALAERGFSRIAIDQEDLQRPFGVHNVYALR
jgi:FkbM family methyltransferase